MRRDPVPILDNESLSTIIQQEVAQSIGHWDGSLASSRERELKYYLGEPFGNEMEGESQVISTDVADTIEGMLPIILKIFTSSDDVVHFDPNGPEDEEQAKQQTEVANYVFYRQNNGFLVLYQWFKDAMMMKNGVVKYWWEDKQEQTKESYRGLTDAEYRGLIQGEGYIEIEELEHTAQDDPTAAAQIASVRERATQMLQIPQAAQQAQQMLDQIDSTPTPQLHDVTVRIVKDASQLCIEAIPPEEFGISARHNCVSIQNAPFCYHRSKQTISSLREQGCPEEILSELSANNPERDITPEAQRRDRHLDNQWAENKSVDDSMNQVWVTEGFIRIDYDGDGVAELRHFIMPDKTVWVNEEADHINFAAITPIIMPHRWTGRSVSELVMDIQFNKSVLWRQMFNNLYLTNNPQKVVLSSAGGIVQANIDDLLSSRPGGILREYAPNAIRNIETPFVAGASFPMLEYMDGVKETRTGVTRYNQGTDADTLNKTARGIQMIQSAGQERTNLIARIFAETGVKDLMRGIVYMLSHYASKSMTVKLRNKWVDVDPREWKTQYNMTVNVGLGTGNKDVQVAHLSRISEMQMMMMKEGRPYMVTDENIYNVSKLLSEAMSFKHPELFFADPSKVPPEAKKPPPSSDMLKIQADSQEAQAKLQFEQQKEPFRAQSEQALAQIQAQTAIAVAQINAQVQKEIAQMKLAAEAQLAVFDKTNPGAAAPNQLEIAGHQLEIAKANAELELERAKAAQEAELAVFKAKLDAETKVAVAEISAKSAVDSTLVKAESDVNVALGKDVGGAGGAASSKPKPQTPINRLISAHESTATQSKAGTDQIGAAILALNETLAQIAKLNASTLEYMKSDKSVSIKDTKLGSDGMLTGATISQKMQ